MNSEAHVTDLVLDFCEDQLSPEDRKRVEAHLDVCAECRADFDWMGRLVESSQVAGYRHIAPRRLVAIADGEAGGMREGERHHFMLCNVCSQELEWMESVRPAGGMTFSTAGPEVISAPAKRVREQGLRWGLLRSRPRPWTLGVMGTAAAAVLMIAVLREHTGTTGREVASLARLEPLTVYQMRGPVLPDTFELRYREGKRAYRDGSWDDAAKAFEAAGEVNPEHEDVFLLLGSTRLLQGHAADAVPLLQKAVDNARTTDVRSEALWMLANAQLMLEKPQASLALLRELVRDGGEHSGNAAQLIDSLARRGWK